MKSIDELKEIIAQNRTILEQKYKVKSLAFFGSFVRGDQTDGSDIDVMVEFSEPVGLLFIHLADYLEEILGMKVDLLTPEAVKLNRKKHIMSELEYV
uniref:DNA polymerase beta domain protein region n=1 Tax=Chlorobium phaeobacteroides (strain BS1) TaxID=331678 RepID=B3EM19_CHLPB